MIAVFIAGSIPQIRISGSESKTIWGYKLVTEAKREKKDLDSGKEIYFPKYLSLASLFNIFKIRMGGKNG